MATRNWKQSTPLPISNLVVSLLQFRFVFLSFLLISCGGGSGSGLDDGLGGDGGGSGSDIPGSACAEQISSGRITTPTVLVNSAAACDYYFSGVMRIETRLTIEPGTVIVMAQNASIFMVDSELTAVGTAEQPIRIQGESHLQGFWSGIRMSNLRPSELAYVEIMDGGDSDANAAVYISSGTVGLSHVSVSNSYVDGMDIRYGVTLSQFESNRFFGNAKYGLEIDTPHISSLDVASDYYGEGNRNGLEGVRVSVSASSPDEDQHWKSINAPYAISYIGNRTGDHTVDAGVEFAMLDGASFFIYGEDSSMTLNGTAQNPIIIRSSIDSSGSWDELEITNLTINHAEISGAENAIWVDEYKQVTLSNTLIRDNTEHGIYCEEDFNSSVTTDNLRLGENVVFRNNGIADMSEGCPY